MGDLRAYLCLPTQTVDLRGPDPAHLDKLLYASKRAVLPAVLHDTPRQSGPNPPEARQIPLRRVINVDQTIGLMASRCLKSPT